MLQSVFNRIKCEYAISIVASVCIFHMAGRSPALPRRGPCLGRQQTPRDEVPSLRSVILTNKVAMVLLIDEAAIYMD